MVYSRKVKKKFPKMYKGAAFTIAASDTEEISDRGRRGFSAKGGKGLSSWTVPLQSRYAAIGNQSMGTMYHLVLVKISNACQWISQRLESQYERTSKYSGPNNLADCTTWRG